MNITEAINSTIILFYNARIAKTPHKINQGYCYIFASYVKKTMKERGLDVLMKESIEYASPKKLTPHVWIYYNGKHYDAEKPNGVIDFHDLPIFNKRKGLRQHRKTKQTNNEWVEEVR